MAAIGASTGTRPNVPGNKIGAGIIWTIGCIMTYAALDQMTEWGPGTLFGVSLALQAVLTFGQSPVWSGRGSIIAYAMLGIDAVINFGGTMAVLVNLDQMGSVQALTTTFADYNGAWPMWLKGIIALAAAALVAGLPEFLWKLD